MKRVNLFINYSLSFLLASMCFCSLSVLAMEGDTVLIDNFEIMPDCETQEGKKTIYICKKCDGKMFYSLDDAKKHLCECHSNSNLPVNQSLVNNNVLSNLGRQELQPEGVTSTSVGNSTVGGVAKAGDVVARASGQGMTIAGAFEKIGYVKISDDKESFACNKCSERRFVIKNINAHFALIHGIRAFGAIISSVGRAVVSSKNKINKFEVRVVCTRPNRDCLPLLIKNDFVKKLDNGKFECLYPECNEVYSISNSLGRHFISAHGADINKKRSEQTSDIKKPVKNKKKVINEGDTKRSREEQGGSNSVMHTALVTLILPGVFDNNLNNFSGYNPELASIDNNKSEECVEIIGENLSLKKRKP